MKRKRTIVSILTPLVGLCAGLPTAALAGAPLLDGYGGPGAGAQTILGAALVNGSRGGASGGGASGGVPGGNGAGTGSGPASAATSAGGSAPGSHSATGTRDGARGTHRSHRARTTVGGAPGTHPRAAGANPNSSHLGASAAVTTSTAATSWFSGADLLALLLSSGALALVAVATVRLTRTEHH